MSVRPPQGPSDGRMDGRTDGWMDIQISPVLQDFVSSGSLRSRCPTHITATITKYQSRARVPMTISCLWATGYSLFFFQNNTLNWIAIEMIFNPNFLQNLLFVSVLLYFLNSSRILYFFKILLEFSIFYNTFLCAINLFVNFINKILADNKKYFWLLIWLCKKISGY